MPRGYFAIERLLAERADLALWRFLPFFAVIQVAYVDDLIIAGLVPQVRAACTPGHSSECPHCRDDGGNLSDVVTLQRALDSYKLAEAEMAEGKATPLSTQFTAWGTDVDGMGGVE